MKTEGSSLVDEGRSVGPEEEDAQGEDEAVAQEGEKMVVHDLKQQPDGRGAGKHPARDLLVPPQEEIGSCKHNHNPIRTS